LTADLNIIAAAALTRESENFRFRDFLRANDPEKIDAIVHRLNDTITPAIDCTACGNCCRSLMIHTTTEEHARLAAAAQIPLATWEARHIETSLQGATILNAIPCAFLKGSLCSVYEDRFQECREFPHLHRDNFNDRLFSTLMYYGTCPIIYNVVEELKVETGFLAILPG
jgi:Fe-S-cluster containining protein